jgi:hypothetical protein
MTSSMICIADDDDNDDSCFSQLRRPLRGDSGMQRN